MWPLVLDEIPAMDGAPLAEIYDKNFTEEPSEVQFGHILSWFPNLSSYIQKN